MSARFLSPQPVVAGAAPAKSVIICCYVLDLMDYRILMRYRVKTVGDGSDLFAQLTPSGLGGPSEEAAAVSI